MDTDPIPGQTPTPPAATVTEPAPTTPRDEDDENEQEDQTTQGAQTAEELRALLESTKKESIKRRQERNEARNTLKAKEAELAALQEEIRLAKLSEEERAAEMQRKLTENAERVPQLETQLTTFQTDLKETREQLEATQQALVEALNLRPEVASLLTQLTPGQVVEWYKKNKEALNAYQTAPQPLPNIAGGSRGASADDDRKQREESLSKRLFYLRS